MQELWHKNSIVCTIEVQSFADGNGDGIGDLPGLSGKLDYLSGLNVNCIWLQPFFPPPRRDDGYDISDYYNVDSRYGTLGDFVDFSQAARDRGIRVIADLVVNHTSIDHRWFQEAGETEIRNTGTGTSGQRRSRRTLSRAWLFRASRRPPGPSMNRPANIITTAFTITSLI